MPRTRKRQWPPLPRRTRGTGSLQRLADGTLRARLPARISPTRQSREFGPDDLTQAGQWLDAHLQGGTHTGSTELADWYGYWWENTIKPASPLTTVRTYASALKHLASIGRVPLSELRPSHFQTMVGQMTARLSPVTVESFVSVWKRCLEAAVDDELISRNPVRKLKLPKIPRTKVRRGWTEKEARALWAAIRGDRFETIYTLVLGCGLRIGEVLGLSWENIDLSGHRAWIGPQWTNNHWRDAPKGNNPHWIHLPAGVVASLIRHRDAQNPASPLVFPSRVKPGQPWSYHTVRTDLIRLAREVGITEKKLHAGRHALGSYLIEEGISPPVVADILGHADASVTLGIYAHATERGVERAHKAVDAFFPEGVSVGIVEDKGDNKGDGS